MVSGFFELPDLIALAALTALTLSSAFLLSHSLSLALFLSSSLIFFHFLLLLLAVLSARFTAS